MNMLETVLFSFAKNADTISTILFYFQVPKASVKIGYYLRSTKFRKNMQTAESIPVRYGPSSEWARPLHHYRNQVDEDENLPKGMLKWHNLGSIDKKCNIQVTIFILNKQPQKLSYRI